MIERLMTAEDVRQYINVKSVRTVYRKANSGELPCYRVGNQLRFKREEIDKAMKEGNNAKKGETRDRCHLAEQVYQTAERIARA